MNKEIANQVSYILGYKLPKLTPQEKQYNLCYDGLSWRKGKAQGWDKDDNVIMFDFDKILKSMPLYSKTKIEMRSKWITKYNNLYK